MKNTKKIVYMIVLVVAVLGIILATGCEVDKAAAPENLLNTTPVKNYDLSTLDAVLISNKMFLWKENVSATEIATANMVSSSLDNLAVEKTDNNEEITTLEAPYKTAYNELRELKRQKSDLQDLIDEETDADIIAGYEAQKATLISQINQKTDEKNSLQDALDVNPRYNALKDRNAEIDSTATDMIYNKLQKSVDYYDYPPEEINIHFIEETNKTEINIYGWNLEDGEGAQDFSTEDGSITNVSYKKFGGVLKFIVKSKNSDKYKFEIARAKYEKDGKYIFFVGDLTRFRNGKKRRGVVKLSNLNN